MKEETKDNIPQYREVTRIKTQDEYEKAKRRLEYYVKEYAWLQQSENPRQEVREELQKLMPMVQGNHSESERYYLRCINLLINKDRQIKEDVYLANVRRNITALLVTTRQYEQSQKDYSILDILKGIIRRDQTVLQDMKLDGMFSRIMTFGNVPGEEDLSLQSPDDLVQYIGKTCRLVGIPMPSPEEAKENMALVPVEGSPSRYQDFISQMVDDYVKENTPMNPKQENLHVQVDNPFMMEKSLLEQKRTVEQAVGKSEHRGRPKSVEKGDKDEGEISE